MAVAGFACSVAVLLITALMILVPSLADVPDAVVGLLLLAGAILWVSGLVLSLLARSRTHRFHRLANTALIVSIASAEGREAASGSTPIECSVGSWSDAHTSRTDELQRSRPRRAVAATRVWSCRSPRRVRGGGGPYFAAVAASTPAIPRLVASDSSRYRIQAQLAPPGSSHSLRPAPG